MNQNETNDTVVLDPATMAKALTALGKAIGSQDVWRPVADDQTEQKFFLNWFGRYASYVEMLAGLNIETATTADPLNKFLVDNGFEPKFREISQGGVGACAILDMLVEWAAEATLTSFRLYAPDYKSLNDYTAFEMPMTGVEIFDVNFSKEKLVKINTKDGGALWLVMNDRPDHPLSMLQTTSAAMASRQPADTTWVKSVIVPTIEIDTEADLSWMLGARFGSHIIDQAFQLVKMRINHEGARVKTATGFGTMRGGPRMPQPLTFNRPFTGWFTQPGSEVPIAVFYCDTDSWKAPAGSLTDL